MHHATTQLVEYIVVALFIIRAFVNSTCPSKCQCCTNITVKCNDRDLRTIPKGIPLTARTIDLSNNPQLLIPSDYFLQFKQLYVLSLTNCGQRGPVYIPKTVRDIRLDDNFFSVDAIEEMISNNLTSLKRITLANNTLNASDTKAVLKTLPEGLTLLNINYNTLTQLPREEMLRFKKMKSLQIHQCSLESIESHVFDNMGQLRALNLESNKLRFLPDNLFNFNGDLYELKLSSNRLVDFNATKLGLKTVIMLEMAYNGLMTFDIRNLKPYVSMLNNNKIRRVETSIFNNNTQTFEINLSSNNIQFISRDAFRGVRRLSQILLNNNSLESLPKDLFNGMMIKSVYLQNNALSNLNGVFHGIQNHTVTLMLAENKRFTLFNGSEFQSLPRNSTIYLNCGKITSLINLSELKATIDCIPKVDKTITTLDYMAFACKGYQCTEIKQPVIYKCNACKQGYKNICRTLATKKGSCVKCPPGSYYQDETASVECKTCRPGQFVPPERSPGTSAADCQTCPEGTNTSDIAGTRACKCLKGYSRWYRFGPCIRCKDHGFDCSHDYQILQKGFWMTWQGTTPGYKTKVEHQNFTQKTCEHVYKAYIRNLKITDNTYDRRTMHFNCQMPLPIKCPMEGSCAGGIEPTCSKGYTGVLCAVCKRGYTRQFNQCDQCPKRGWAVIQFISCAALLVFGFFCISLTDKCNIEYHMQAPKGGQTVNQRTFADIILASLKILIGFYQVLISIIHASSNVLWPDNVKRSINILQYIQFEIIKFSSLRCINSRWNINAIEEFWIILIIAITVPCLAVVYYLSKSLYIHCLWSSLSEAKKQRYICGRNCIKFVALFLYVIYTFTLTKIIQLLPISCHSFCTAKQNGTCVHSMSFLRSDYSLTCRTVDEHKATVVIACVCLILPVGLPALLLMLLKCYVPGEGIQARFQINTITDEHNDNEKEYSDQHELNFSSTCGDHLFGDPTVPMMTSALRFTYENYHHRYWYWEVVEMIRKLLMTAVVIPFAGHTKVGLTCTIIVAMIFTILHAVVRPFKSKFESGAQFLSLTFILLNLAFWAVLQSQDTKGPSFINNKLDSSFLSSLLVVMNSCLIFLIVTRFIVLAAVGIKSRRQMP